MKVLRVASPELLSNEEIQSLFLQLLDEILNSQNHLNLEILQRCMDIILWKIEKSSTSSAKSDRPDDEFSVFLKFNAEMSMECKKTRKVNDYSAKLGVTTRKLSTICLKFSGKTAKTMINERVIAESKQKLYLNHLPLKSIAAQLGFFDQYQFSSFFKKHAKISPSSFRQKVINSKNICPTPAKKRKSLLY